MNKVTFLCKRSGNTVSFASEVDIISMRKHEGYTEVKDVETSKTVEIEPPKATTEEVLKPKRGRPFKVEVPAFLEG